MPNNPQATSASGGAVTNVRISGGGRATESEDRVSLAPLKPETALRALLATPPMSEDDLDDQPS